MSLIDGQKNETRIIPGDGYCFYKLFDRCAALTTAPELPATSLANDYYYEMFHGCTSLTSAPELPATTLTPYCYYSMFQNCTGLTSAPELPATSLAYSCYDTMFWGCTGLSLVTCLATSGINQNNSTSNWLKNVAASGSFIKHINALTWQTNGELTQP